MKELFNGLNKLCEENEAFYYSEQEYKTNYIVRSYSYRLATYSDFLLPYAKECRGTAFLYNKTTKEWTLFCRGISKFFNLGEGISKFDYIKNNKPICSFEKIDGSLILFGLIDGKVVAKSKTSICSDHAKQAQELIDNNDLLYSSLFKVILMGFTPVMELVGPNFKIVLNYPKEELIYLCIVDNEFGSRHNITEKTKEFKKTFGARCAEPYNFSWSELDDIQSNSSEDIEGFVVLSEKGFVKVKINKYVNLHRMKDSISNNKNLIDLIINDNLDDLIGMFQDDNITIAYINEIQDLISKYYNHLVQEFIDIEKQFNTKFNQNRKDFAMEFKTHKLFPSIMKGLCNSDLEKTAEKSVKDYILRITNTKTQADNLILHLKQIILYKDIINNI